MPLRRSQISRKYVSEHNDRVSWARVQAFRPRPERNSYTSDLSRQPS